MTRKSKNNKSNYQIFLHFNNHYLLGRVFSNISHNVLAYSVVPPKLSDCTSRCFALPKYELLRTFPRAGGMRYDALLKNVKNTSFMKITPYNPVDPDFIDTTTFKEKKPVNSSSIILMIIMYGTRTSVNLNPN